MRQGMVGFTRNGGKTRARTPILALVYWYVDLESSKELSENLALVLYRGPVFTFHEGKAFIDQIVSCIERHFGQTPDIDTSASYDEQCRQLLLYLEQIGDISELDFNATTHF